MAKSLAVKYRPQSFEDVSSQTSTIKILNKQLESKQYSNVYGFSGPTGVGKTTLARIFANAINGRKGNPIEIDGASNNGVDNIRNIVMDSRERSIDSEYKVYIIDECHMITSAGWNAFLKTLEEPPVFTIFMFCTTDPQKIPQSIKNRLMNFNLTKIPTEQVIQRLDYICKQEGFKNFSESIEYIAKISDGGMRDAIAMLEKSSTYSKDLTIGNVLKSLGNFSHSTLFALTNAIVDGNEKEVINIIESIYGEGNDLKLFVDSYLDFTVDLTKFSLFNDIKVTKIPTSMESEVKYSTSFTNNVAYFNNLNLKILDLKTLIKNDSSIKTTIMISILKLCKG
jgi:DNA polymerase III subunit gamma/tau